jgi:hypothetical protein
MKTTIGIVVTVFGGATWILAFLSLMTEYSTRRTPPSFAIGYLLPSTLIVYIGIRVFQAGRRKSAPQLPAPTPSPISGTDRRPSIHGKSTQSAGTPTVACLFDINIPEASVRDNGVYEIAHATPYTIVLANQHDELRCDAKVWIDGNVVGTWRVEPASRIRLERPVNDTGRFTFFQTGTPEARQAGLDPANPALGLIRVKFMPEAPRGPHILASSPGSLEDGGTGLSGHSEQTFGSAAAIRHDEFREVMSEIRLIPRPHIRPLRPVTS